ncbi:MAG: EspA/EspE family type VII secretion system effector [Pseudonocardiaceae bacterium]
MNNPLIDNHADILSAHPGLRSMSAGFDGDRLDRGSGWEKGLTSVEAGEEIGEGIAQGDWAKVALGGVGAGLDMLCAGFDPIDYASGQLASWMMEHLEPLRLVLHGLTGEPDMVKGYAATWDNISTRMSSVSGDYAAAADATSSFWGGPASDAYRSHAHHVANLAQAAAGAANTLKTAATMAGELVAGIRVTVRDAIAALVGYLVDLLVEEGCTLGLATPVVIAQGVDEISRVSVRIGESLTKLGKAISELAGWLAALRNMLDGVYTELSALAESGHAQAQS